MASSSRSSPVDSKSISAILVIALIALALGAMALGWWARKKRQSGYAHLVEAPDNLGESYGEFTGLYLATTPADAPLERLVVNGLAFRERTTLQFTDAGIVFLGDRYLPTASITGVGRASWTIDRGVEPEGLSVVNWMLGDEAVDSYFRLDDPEGFITVGTEYMKRVEK
jgi:hypothetical protein